MLELKGSKSILSCFLWYPGLFCYLLIVYVNCCAARYCDVMLTQVTILGATKYMAVLRKLSWVKIG
jgi:hypothetical protein